MTWMGNTYIKLWSIWPPPLIFYFIVRSFYVVTNKWTKYTSYEVNEENLCILSKCSKKGITIIEGSKIEHGT